MHEMSLLNSLMNKLHEVAAHSGGRRVVALRVRLGALSHFSPEHFREHFAIASKGTLAEGARLELQVMGDIHDPDAQGVVLESIECEV
ncbi:MAG: hydrogenase maturation nickel metallochaperone HypA [Myxococcales bacterium]|nr:hydrogenase maturation nickel metallochaperone HypA [Myxococcales bacterium]MDD9967363.1 hydrogenase maturation nickel metallochaperone HypA [Myxococcales bacterium]